MKEKLKALWRWLREEVLNKEMIVYVIIAELIFWSPVIVCALLSLIVSKWFWTATLAIIAFWAGPFTPAVPLQLGLAILLKKVVQKIKAKRHKKDGSDDGSST